MHEYLTGFSHFFTTNGERSFLLRLATWRFYWSFHFHMPQILRAFRTMGTRVGLPYAYLIHRLVTSLPSSFPEGRSEVGFPTDWPYYHRVELFSCFIRANIASWPNYAGWSHRSPDLFWFLRFSFCSSTLRYPIHFFGSSSSSRVCSFSVYFHRTFGRTVGTNDLTYRATGSYDGGDHTAAGYYWLTHYRVCYTLECCWIFTGWTSLDTSSLGIWDDDNALKERTNSDDDVGTS